MQPAIKASDVRKEILKQIDEMEAGREFNKFVTREVMIDEGPREWTQRNDLSLYVLEKANNEYGAEIITRPSGHTRVTLRFKPKDRGACFFTPLIEIIGTAETFPLAICRACAKKAIMEKWENKDIKNGNQTNNP